VHTGAQAIAKYGSVQAFYTHIGYAPQRFWVLSPTGNDGTGAVQTTLAAALATPFATYNSTMNVGVQAGDMIVLRDGWNGSSLTPPKFGNARTPTMGNPLYIVAYPGEQP